MRRRCDDPNNPFYHHYGGRGIIVCEEWNKSFSAFHRDMSDSYQKGLSIDRMDNNGNYCKENCRWVIKSVNNANKRSNGKYLRGTKPNGRGSDFQARIKVFDVEYYIGNYKTMEEAHKAYLEVYREWYGF